MQSSRYASQYGRQQRNRNRKQRLQTDQTKAKHLANISGKKETSTIPFSNRERVFLRLYFTLSYNFKLASWDLRDKGKHNNHQFTGWVNICQQIIQIQAQQHFFSPLEAEYLNTTAGLDSSIICKHKLRNKEAYIAKAC